MEDADAIAIERAKAGDSDGFRTLVQRHSRSVFRLAYRMTGNEFDAEKGRNPDDCAHAARPREVLPQAPK